MGARQRVLRIGTRGSDLALWQSRHVAERLAALPGAPPCEVVSLHTSGDLISDVPLWQVAGKQFFTLELEVALAASEVDLVVHSLKDLATVMPSGLALAAVLARDDSRDALVSTPGTHFDLDTLPRGARIGTSSLRRQALVARWRSDLELVDLRGNVPTRLRKLDDGRFDAIVLAAAGLARLGLEPRIDSYLPVKRFLPAVGQGAIAVQVRSDDAETRRWAELLDHPATRVATTSERALLGRLEGGCQVPVGALGELIGDRLTLNAIVCSLDGTNAIEGRSSRRVFDAADAAALGEALAEELLRRGADEILAAIRAK